MKIVSFRATIISALFVAVIAQGEVMAANPLVAVVEKISQVVGGGATTVPGAGNIEVAFSPKGGGEDLIIKAIDSAQSEIKMLAYAFTSSRITGALIKAAKRGVTVSLAADAEHNLSRGGESTKGRSALSALATAGVNVHVVSAFAIHHDKLIVVDGKHVQSGSFNYTASAQTRNSEYVMVNWNNPELARVMLTHFNRNFSLGKPYSASY